MPWIRLCINFVGPYVWIHHCVSHSQNGNDGIQNEWWLGSIFGLRKKKHSIIRGGHQCAIKPWTPKSSIFIIQCARSSYNVCIRCLYVCVCRNERFHWKYPTTISSIENETAIVRMSESLVCALEIVHFVYVIAHPHNDYYVKFYHYLLFTH